MHIASGLSRAWSASRCFRISAAHGVYGQTAGDVAAGFEERRDRRAVRIEWESFGRRLELHAAAAAPESGVGVAAGGRCLSTWGRCGGPRLVAAGAACPPGAACARAPPPPWPCRPPRPPPRGGPLFARCQTPEKSGLPSAVRGVGASMRTVPFASRGTLGSGCFGHWALTEMEQAAMMPTIPETILFSLNVSPLARPGTARAYANTTPGPAGVDPVPGETNTFTISA